MTECWSQFTGSSLRPGGLNLTKLLLGYLPESPVPVLDVGCGSGEAVALLVQRGYQAWGLDISEKAINKGHSAHPEATLLVGDAVAMPFANGQFAAVLCECSLSILPVAAWRECARVLRLGGVLLVSDVYAHLDQGQAAPLTLEGWKTALAAEGFSIKRFGDMSEEWNNYIAQLLWDYGSLDQLCCYGDVQQLRNCQPGYFWAVAKKE